MIGVEVQMLCKCRLLPAPLDLNSDQLFLYEMFCRALLHLTWHHAVPEDSALQLPRVPEGFSVGVPVPQGIMGKLLLLNFYKKGPLLHL